MSKTEDCDRCENFSGYDDEHFLVCAIHPAGPEESPCPDWVLVVEDDSWFPVGAVYVEDELVLTQTHFLEVCERNVESMIHPRFTGRCSQCGNEFDGCQPPPVHWDCNS